MSSPLLKWQPVSSLPFLGEVLEQVVAAQLRDFLGRLLAGPIVDTSVTSLCWELERGRLVLLLLLSALDSVNSGIFPDPWPGLGLHCFCSASDSSWRAHSRRWCLGDSCWIP